MLGFTKQEQGIVLFLIFTLLVGSLVTLYNRYFKQVELPEVKSQLIEEFYKHAKVEKEFLINVNKANSQELQNLPKIGPIIAKRIIEYRQKNGEFKTLEQLKDVQGIGVMTLKLIEPYISLK